MVSNRTPNARVVRLLPGLVSVQRNGRYFQSAISALRSSPVTHLASYRNWATAHFASMSREAPPDARSLVTRLKNVLLGTSIGLLFAFGYYYVTDTGASIHQWLVVPSLRRIYDDAEESHKAGTKALKGLYGVGLHPRERGNLDSAGNLEVEVNKPEMLSKPEILGAKRLQ